jgi:hypothetical protein
MGFSKAKASFPVVLFILISVLVSIMAINYYNVDMNIKDGFLVEGMCGRKGDSGRQVFLMEGMKNNSNDEEKDKDEKEEDLASISAFTKTLLN